jgi:hypothetical protein
MSKTKALLMMVAECMYPELKEDEQVLAYLFSHPNDETEDYSQ